MKTENHLRLNLNQAKLEEEKKMAKLTKRIASLAAEHIVRKEFDEKLAVAKQAIIDKSREIWNKYAFDENIEKMVALTEELQSKGYRVHNLDANCSLYLYDLNFASGECEMDGSYISVRNNGFKPRPNNPYESCASFGKRGSHDSQLHARRILPFDSAPTELVDEVVSQLLIVAGLLDTHQTLRESAKDRFNEIRRTIMSFGTDKKLFESIPELAELPCFKENSPAGTGTSLVSLKEIDSIRSSLKVMLGINTPPQQGVAEDAQA